MSLKLHPNPEEEPVDLQTALGRLVMCWAPLEATIDLLCVVIFHKFDKGTIETEAPRAFGRKIDYVKRCFAKLLTLHPLDASSRPVIEAAQALSTDRHWLTHGFLVEPENELSAIHFTKLAYGKTRHNIAGKSFTVADIYELSSKCLQIGDLLATLGNGLLQLSLILDERNKTNGKN